MKVSSVAGWLVVFVMSAHTGMGQAGAPHGRTEKIELSAPLNLPVIFSLHTLPQRLSVEDSLDRRAYARNRVKTVALMRQRQGQPDTAEYAELDRHGNKTLVAKPYFGQHRQQRFDKQNRLVEVAMLMTPTYPLSSRTVYEPARQLHTTYVTARGAAPMLWQQSRRTRHSDTLLTDFLFQPVPDLQAGSAHRVLIRAYRLGTDTAISEVMGYNAANQPIEFSAYYKIGKSGQVRESGELDFRPQAVGSSAAQQVADVPMATLLQRNRQRRGRFVANTRNMYDAGGQLIQTTFISAPNLTATAPASAKSADGRASMTVSDGSCLLGYTTRYTRIPDGRIQREDRTYELRPGSSDLEREAFRPSSIVYEYAPNGLLLRKTDSASLNGKPVVYEAKYTYH